MFVKYISPDYFRYNPTGKTYFKLEVCPCCGQYYVKEVGVFNQKDKNLNNDVLHIKYEDEEFTVYKTTEGLFRSIKGCAATISY